MVLFHKAHVAFGVGINAFKVCTKTRQAIIRFSSWGRPHTQKHSFVEKKSFLHKSSCYFVRNHQFLQYESIMCYLSSQAALTGRWRCRSSVEVLLLWRHAGRQRLPVPLIPSEGRVLTGHSSGEGRRRSLWSRWWGARLRRLKTCGNCEHFSESIVTAVSESSTIATPRKNARLSLCLSRCREQGNQASKHSKNKTALNANHHPTTLRWQKFVLWMAREGVESPPSFPITQVGLRRRNGQNTFTALPSPHVEPHRRLFWTHHQRLLECWEHEP